MIGVPMRLEARPRGRAVFISERSRKPRRIARIGLSSAQDALILLSALVSLAVIMPSSAIAGESSSASYRHIGGEVASVAAVGSAGLLSSAPGTALGSASAVVGGAATRPAGSETSLRSVLPGFLAIVVGVFPSLDLDGDLAQYFLDEDDDGDGLLDAVETATGFFVTALNTGSSPVLADSDGDGYWDGVEVAAGFDPNVAASNPGTPAVPLLQLPMLILFCASLVMLALRLIRPRPRPRPRRHVV